MISRAVLNQFSHLGVQQALDRLRLAVQEAIVSGIHNDLVDRDVPGCHPPQAIATGMTTAARVALVAPPSGTVVWDIELLRAFSWNGSAWTEV